ncbi:MAG: hypothetical protein Q9221_008670 [Calogaya cf. arnoldii]
MVIPQAVAQNFATLLVSRAIAGALGGILQNAIAQFSTDLWATDEERNLPVTLYSYVYVAGVTLGPALGSIVGNLSWRWVFYVQLIIYCSLAPVVLALIKETRGSVLLKEHARKDQSLTGAMNDVQRPSLSTLLWEAVSPPATLLVTEPVVFFLTLWAAFCFGLVFIMTQSVAQVYHETYGFGDPASGLVQISLRSAERNTVDPGVPIPEARLSLSIPASLVGLGGGLFWYAWATFPHVHWMVPTIGLAFVGFGIVVIITAVDLYIADAYLKFAGSAIAAMALGDNLFAAWLPLAAKSMYTNLGFRWASSLLGFVALVLTLAPIA